MKFVLMLVVAAIAIAIFSARLASSFDREAHSPKVRLSTANELLRRAAAGEPLDGRPAPDQRWVARMTAACAKRERLLVALPRPATLSAIAARGARILAIHRAYAARVSSIHAPAAYTVEARELRGFDNSQQRILRRVVAAAQSGNVARAYRESVALRELAGRANTVLLRLGLSRCVFSASSMPL